MAVRIVPVTTLDPAQAELAEAWNDAFIVATVDTRGDDHDAWSMASRRARESSDSGTIVTSLPPTRAIRLSRERPSRCRCGTTPRSPSSASPSARSTADEGSGQHSSSTSSPRPRQAGPTSLAAETAYPKDGTDPGEAVARLHGFDLAQTNHRNDLDVAQYRDEGARDTPGYVIATSTNDTKDEWLEDRAHLQQRMSTDSPVGALDFEEEDWDAERLRGERTATAQSGRGVIESVARHVETGRLVAFTQVGQHGGLRAEFPQTLTVRTWNAQDNRPMIAVNEALGYRTTAIQREWQKRLA